MINQMNVGKDYSLAYFDTDTQQIVDLGDVQDVSIRPVFSKIKSTPYNDVPRFGYIPDGYEVGFSIVRTGPALEEFQLASNARFNAGQNSGSGFLSETVKNPDGSVSRYQYTGFVFAVTDLGTISRDKPVAMKAEGMAADKVKIA